MSSDTQDVSRRGSTRQTLYQGTKICRLGIYVNERSGNLFYGWYRDGENADNRVKPTKVWIDDDGFICVSFDPADG